MAVREILLLGSPELWMRRKEGDGNEISRDQGGIGDLASTLSGVSRSQWVWQSDSRASDWSSSQDHLLQYA
ncbi:MAG: hypothetical protein IPJ07_06460 [Acidobacteria bacterium]|nr:hypothetical protein [Acidobacteriota bacterium]